MKTVEWKNDLSPWEDRSVVIQLDGKTAAALSFEWSGNHNVFLFEDEKSFKKCDFSTATQMATTSPYMFSTTTPGTYYFGCGVGKHCKKDLKMKFQVIASATTNAPIGIFLLYVY